MTPRVALVGGGSRGIGRATAQALISAGLHVTITGRHENSLATTARELSDGVDTRVEYLVSDLADPASAEPTIAAVERDFGSLDVLVINASGPPPGRILDVSDETWRASMELLLLGPLRLARLALPAMAKRGYGRVVVVTATAVRQPQPDIAISVVLRAAVTNAVKLLSREYADHGVTVNAVAPGATATGRRQEILDNRARKLGLSYEEIDNADRADIPAGRPGEPAEIAAAIAFLASPAASYVNGVALTVDGGRTETI